MNKYFDEYRLRAGLQVAPAPETVGELARHAHRILDLLGECQPQWVQGLKIYQASREPGFPPLAPDFSNLEQQLLMQAAHGWRDLFPQLELLADPSGTLLPHQPLVKDMSITVGRSMSMRAPEFTSLMFSAVPANQRMPGGALEVRLDLPRGPGKEFQDPAFLRRLFRQLIQAHPATECAALSNAAIDDGTTCYGSYGVNLGWLTYVAEPEVAAHLPAGVKWEPFANGVLIDLQDAAPGDDVAGLVARAVQVRDALAPGGWLMVKRLRGLGYRLPYKVYDPAYGGTPPALN